MLSKNNSKILVIVLLVLLAVYAVMHFANNSESNMKTDLVAVDTVKVNKIVIMPPGAPKIVLTKDGGQWQLFAKGETHPADKTRVKYILENLLNLKAKSVVATEEKQWKRYEVSDSLGTRIKLMNDDKTLSDIILGKFNFIAAKNSNTALYGNRPQGDMISYVRLYNDDNVYSVDGMIKMSIGAEPDNYRNKNFVNLQPSQIKKINFTYPDTLPFILEKEDQGWKIDGQAADSAAVARYLSLFENVNGTKFAKNLDLNKTPFIGKIKIELIDAPPVVFTAYSPDSNKIVMHSSLNKDAWFDDDSGKLHKRFYVRPSYFFKKE